MHALFNRKTGEILVYDHSDTLDKTLAGKRNPEDFERFCPDGVLYIRAHGPGHLDVTTIAEDTIR